MSMWRVLKDDKVLILFTGRLFSNFGDGLMFIAITWLTYTQTNSVLAVGWVSALTTMPGIICMPLIGVLLDRFDRRICAMIVEFFQFFLLMIWIYLLQTRGFNIIVLYIFAILLGISQSVTLPALFSLIPEVFIKDRILKINSLLDMSAQAGYLLGSSMGGIMLVRIRPTGAIFIDGLTFAISGIALLFLRKGIVSPAQEAVEGRQIWSIFASLAETLSYTRKRGDIFSLILMGISTWLVTMVLNVLLAPFTKEVLHTGAWGFGLLDSIFGVGSIIGGLSIGWFEKNFKKQVIGLGFLITTALLFVFGANSLFIIGLVVDFLMGVAVQITSTFIDTYLQLRADNSFLGRISSTIRFGGSILGSVAMYSVALIAQNSSFFVSFSTLALYVGLIGLLALVCGIRYEFDQTFEIYANNDTANDADEVERLK